MARLNEDDGAKTQALWKIQADLSKKMKSNERKVKRRAAELRNNETQLTLSPNESAERNVQEHVDEIEPTPGTSQVEARDLTFEDGTKRALDVRKDSRRRAKTSSRSKAKELEMTTEEIFISTEEYMTADDATPEGEVETYHSHFYNLMTGNYEAYRQRQRLNPFRIRSSQLAMKDRLDQVSIASVEGPVREEIDEFQSHRVKLDVKPPQDLQPEESKSHKFTTYRSQEGPRLLKTLTPIRRTQAQIMSERFDRTEIDKEDPIDMEEPSESRISPLQDKITKLKVTDEEEKAPELSCGIEEGIFEVSFDQGTTDLEGTTGKIKLPHQEVSGITHASASVRILEEVANTATIDTPFMDVENDTQSIAMYEPLPESSSDEAYTTLEEALNQAMSAAEDSTSQTSHYAANGSSLKQPTKQ